MSAGKKSSKSSPDPKVLSIALGVLTDYLGDMVLDPDLVYSFGEIEYYETASLRFGGSYWTVRIPVSRNRRDHLLGVGPDTLPSRSGPNRSYLAGLIDGALVSAFGREVADLYFFWLDVAPSDDAEYSTQLALPRAISISEAIKTGVISPKSPLVPIMRKYHCSTLALSGSYVLGPSPDMVRVLDGFLKEFAPTSVCDMFSGTGVLGKQCYYGGAGMVEFVDLWCEAIKNNTKDVPISRLRIRESDAFHYVAEHSFDLFILDPYYDLSLRVAQEIVPRIRDRARAIIFDITSRADTYWSARVEASLKANLGKIAVAEQGESRIAIWRT